MERRKLTHSPIPRKRLYVKYRTNRKGQFTKGNPGGPGNPITNRGALIRLACQEAATPRKAKRLMAVLYKAGKQGDFKAIQQWFDRSAGRPEQFVASFGEAEQNYNPDDRFL